MWSSPCSPTRANITSVPIFSAIKNGRKVQPPDRDPQPIGSNLGGVFSRRRFDIFVEGGASRIGRARCCPNRLLCLGPARGTRRRKGFRRQLGLPPHRPRLARNRKSGLRTESCQSLFFLQRRALSHLP